MAVRVTADEVREIIDVDASLDLSAFILAANVLVTNRLAGDHDVDTLKEIERWAAAHFVSIREPNSRLDQIGDARREKQVGGLGRQLESTLYGQQAILLDTSGKLQRTKAPSMVQAMAKAD